MLVSNEELSKVIEFTRSGGLVMIISRFVDDFAQVYQDKSGVWLIKSEVFAPMPLIDQPFYDLKFYRRVDL